VPRKAPVRGRAGGERGQIDRRLVQRREAAALVDQYLEAFRAGGRAAPDEARLAELAQRLRAIGEEYRMAVVRRLEQAVATDEPGLRDLLRRLDDPAFIEPLRQLAADARASEETRRVAEALLRELIRDEEIEGFKARARAVLEAPEPAESALDALIGQLRVMARPVSFQAVRQLAAEAGERALPLLRLLAECDDTHLQMTAVEALATVATPAAAAILQNMTDRAAAREVQRAARRALFRLRQSGVQPPAPERTPVIVVQPAQQVLRAWASNIDGSGSRLLWVLMRRRMEPSVLARMILHEREGVQFFTVAPTTTRRALRQVEEHNRDPRGFPLVEIPPEYARGLVAEAEARRTTIRLDADAEFLQWRDVLAPPGTTLPRPPIYELLDADELRGRWSLLAESANLLELEEFASWPFPDDMTDAAFELIQAEQSQLVLSETAREERIEHIVSQAVEQYFTEERRHLFKRRLEEMAYFFLKTGRPDAARRALAAALAFEDPAVPVARHPFARRLVLISIMQARQTLPRRTPSGLILPGRGTV
jgi:hypothetical protein